MAAREDGGLRLELEASGVLLRLPVRFDISTSNGGSLGFARCAFVRAFQVADPTALLGMKAVEMTMENGSRDVTPAVRRSSKEIRER